VRAKRHPKITTSFQKAFCGDSSAAGTLLRGSSEQKPFCTAAVSVKHFPKQGAPAKVGLPAQAQKVGPDLFPCPGHLGAADTAQIIPSPQNGMSAPKSSKNPGYPAGHQPRGDKAIRINLHGCTMKALLSPAPASQPQEQGPQDCIRRVLVIGNQLERQQGEGLREPSAQEPRNGNPFLRKRRKQLHRIPPVGGDLSVAVLVSTDGAGRPDKGGKINPPGQKRFLVFPNRLVCVRVGKLNRSAALPTGGRSLALTPFGLPPRGAWLFFQGQFLTSLFPPPLYHRSENPVNITPQTPTIIGRTNTPLPTDQYKQRNNETTSPSPFRRQIRKRP